MRAGRLAIGLLCAALAVACGRETALAARQPAPVPLDRLLPAELDRIYSTLVSRFDAGAAMETVTFMDRFWRMAVNAGFRQSQDHIHDRLVAAGFEASTPDRGTGAASRAWFEEFADAESRGWDHTRATVSLPGPDGAEEVVLSRERHRVALCINSFPTVPAGIVAPLIDVGAGDEASFSGRDVRGAVVLGDGPVQSLWEEAVRKRGAVGVISTELPSYLTRPAPGVPPDETLDVLQWDNIPYDERLKSFGFKATRRAAAQLRQRLGQGATRVRVQIDASFAPAPNRTLVAEITGAARPDERIVLVAHVQEPGANDDASGCGTLQALAVALAGAIRDGVIPRPARTLTFLWVDEIRGSEQWLKDHAAAARGVRYMFSLDMTGEDTSKTGGTFLIEKEADPSAVWPRPSDPHTEWGQSGVSASSLKGGLLTDLFIAICQRRARDTGWVVRTNPYEGGSDHAVFAEAGIPSLLTWHFTDRYYHTNLDRPDKTSPAEMANVGISVGAAAMLLASADAQEALAIVRLVARAAAERLALERRQSATLIAGAKDAGVRVREAEVLSAWRKWYREALESVLRLPVDGGSEELRQAVAREVSRLGSL